MPMHPRESVEIGPASRSGVAIWDVRLCGDTPYSYTRLKHTLLSDAGRRRVVVDARKLLTRTDRGVYAPLGLSRPNSSASVGASATMALTAFAKYCCLIAQGQTPRVLVAPSAGR